MNNNISIQKEELNKINKVKFYYRKIHNYLLRFILIIIMIFQYFLIHKIYIKENQTKNYKNKVYDINFKYEDYETNIITDKIIKDSGMILAQRESYFINGLIRKNNIKNCLEIGVANGGSAILILNAIKDRENSILVSLDLNNELYNNPKIKTGYRVKKFFPELAKNWKLYTGEQPHKFLVELNMKFDFLFLDSTHVSPGEILNFIESLPFLNENAIVVIHDLLWHFSTKSTIKFYPSCISLLPALQGDKVFLKGLNGGISNIGAAFLYSNQQKHFIDYFSLLLNFLEYMPKQKQITV